MNSIKKSLSLENFSQDGFLRLIDYVIEKALLKKILLAHKTPVSNVPVELYPNHLFDIPLAGLKRIITGDGNSLIEHVLHPGDVLYCAPSTWKQPIWNTAHEMCCFVYTKELIRLTYVVNSANNPNSFRPQCNCFYHTQLPPSEPIKHILKVLEYISTGSSSEDSAVELTQAIFKLTREQVRNDKIIPQTKSQITFSRILQYVSENFHLPINRESVAKIFELHPSHISRLFLQHAGQPFTQILHTMRMEKSASLLANTNLKVEDVMLQCGYSSVTFFTATFKEYYGMPPGKYRTCNLRK